jgi:hypothetical protein
LARFFYRNLLALDVGSKLGCPTLRELNLSGLFDRQVFNPDSLSERLLGKLLRLHPG